MKEADFSHAYYRHKDVVFRFARRMGGSDAVAEDIVHDCYAALWSKRAVFDSNRGSLRTFLIGVARNLLLKRIRDERPQDLLDDDAAAVESIDLVEMERAEAVARAIKRLPALQREAVILAEYEELSLEEISAATGVEIAAVKSRLHRGRENLRRMLRPYVEERASYETRR
jgi:RNA polymerase sigma-70 factor (ECF subfamily)